MLAQIVFVFLQCCVPVPCQSDSLMAKDVSVKLNYITYQNPMSKQIDNGVVSHSLILFKLLFKLAYFFNKAFLSLVTFKLQSLPLFEEPISAVSSSVKSRPFTKIRSYSVQSRSANSLSDIAL